MQKNEFMNIDIIGEDNFNNPSISSPNSPYEIFFAQTRDTLLDVETYKHFIENAISRFRHDRTYKHYKGYLYELGLDKCQFNANINKDMAKIEMHHNMLTIFDIAVIITEAVLKTRGYITTFDLVMLLKQEHINNRVQLVMLSLTPHQLYHNNPDFFIHPDMCIGDWAKFLDMYFVGITRDLAFKIIFYLNRAIEEGGSNDNDLLSLRDRIYDWSQYCE